MKRAYVDFVVGVFLIVGFLGFVYLSLQFGEASFFSIDSGTLLYAKFDSISGLKKGSIVEISGVDVGRVVDISLSPDNRAYVGLSIKRGVDISEDCIASVRTQGIIGDKYIRISQGGSDKKLKSGAIINDTESAVDLEELVSKYIFGNL